MPSRTFIQSREMQDVQQKASQVSYSQSLREHSQIYNDLALLARSGRGRCDTSQTFSVKSTITFVLFLIVFISGLPISHSKTICFNNPNRVVISCLRFNATKILPTIVFRLPSIRSRFFPIHKFNVTAIKILPIINQVAKNPDRSYYGSTPPDFTYVPPVTITNFTGGVNKLQRPRPTISVIWLGYSAYMTFNIGMYIIGRRYTARAYIQGDVDPEDMHVTAHRHAWGPTSDSDTDDDAEHSFDADFDEQRDARRVEQVVCRLFPSSYDYRWEVRECTVHCRGPRDADSGLPEAVVAEIWRRSYQNHHAWREHPRRGRYLSYDITEVVFSFKWNGFTYSFKERHIDGSAVCYGELETRVREAYHRALQFASVFPGQRQFLDIASSATPLMDENYDDRHTLRGDAMDWGSDGEAMIDGFLYAVGGLEMETHPVFRSVKAMVKLGSYLLSSSDYTIRALAWTYFLDELLDIDSNRLFIIEKFRSVKLEPGRSASRFGSYSVERIVPEEPEIDLDMDEDESHEEAHIDGLAEDFDVVIRRLLVSRSLDSFLKLISFLWGAIFVLPNKDFDIGYLTDLVSHIHSGRSIAAMPNVLATIYDHVKTLASTAQEFYETGDKNIFLRNDSEVDAWRDQAVKLLSEVRVHKLNEKMTHEMATLSDRVKKAIVDGEQLQKVVKRSLRCVVLGDLMQLRLANIELSTSARSCSKRDAPFTVLIHGGPGIGKSSLMSAITHYIRLLNPKERILKGSNPAPLPADGIYNRTSGEEYWSCYSNSKWCIQYDDIAQRNVKTPDFALEIQELIYVINNVSYFPPMADCDDKGKTFINPTLVVATTNNLELNAHAACHTGNAVIRRFPIVVTPSVRQEYRSGSKLDSSLARGKLDLWDFEVTLVGLDDNGNIVRSKVSDINSLADLTQFLGKQAVEHFQAQASAGDYDKLLGETICGKCFRNGGCHCDEPEPVVDYISADEKPDDGDGELIPGRAANTLRKRTFMSYKSADGGVGKEERIYDIETKSHINRFGTLFDKKGNVRTFTPETASAAFERVRGRFNPPAEISNAKIEGDFLLPLELPLPDLSFFFTIPYFFWYLLYYICFVCYYAVQVSVALSPFLLIYFIGFARKHIWPRVILFQASVMKLDALSDKFADVLAAFDAFQLGGIAGVVTHFRLLRRDRQTAVPDSDEEMWYLRAVGSSCRYANWVNRNIIVRAKSRWRIILIVIMSAACLMGLVNAWMVKPTIQGAAQGKPMNPGPIPESVWRNSNASSIRNYLFHVGKTAQPVLFQDKVYNGAGVFRDDSSYIHAFNIFGQYWLVPSHWFKQRLANNKTLHFEYSKRLHSLNTGLDYDTFLKTTSLSNFSIQILTSEMQSKELGNDYHIVRLPVISGCDMVKYLPKENLTSAFAANVYVHGESKRVGPYQFTSDYDISEQLSTRGITAKNFYSAARGYDSNTGDCGSPAYIAEQGLCVLVGSHIARRGNSVHLSAFPYEAIRLFQKELMSKNDPGANCIEQISESIMTLQGDELKVDTALHPKNPTNFPGFEATTLVNLGQLVIPHHKFTTQVKMSTIAPFWLALGYLPNKVAPILDPGLKWLPKRNCLLEVAKQKDFIPAGVLSQASFNLFQRLKTIPRSAGKEICILDEESVLNGIPGVPFVDIIKMSTGAGIPYGGKKNDLLEREQGKLRLPTKLRMRLEKLESDMREGKRMHFVFNASLKDEPIKPAKLELGKIRVFQALSFDGLYLIRKYFLAVTSILQRFNFISELAVGVNCHGRDWDDIYNYLFPNLSFRAFDMDYRNYDQQQGAYTMIEAWTNLMMLCKHYSPEIFGSPEMKAMNSLMMDCVYPLVNYFGDLMFFNGSNPSGHALTVIINSLVNSIYIRCAFLVIFGSLDRFDELIRLITYGDDNVVSVHEEIQDKFNFRTVKAALATWQITVTTAQKDSIDVDFIPREQISFLKRSWVPYETGSETIYLAPLEVQSIHNMLILQKRDNLQDEDRCASVLVSSAVEAFQHGEIFYNDHIRKCEKCVEEYNLRDWVDSKTHGLGFGTFADRLADRLSNVSRLTHERAAGFV